MKKSLLEKLKLVEQLASASKIKRLLFNPAKYITAIGYKLFVYRFTKKGVLLKTSTFFDAKMLLLLPSGTDIYLTGGKSDNSEIRLARFIIENLSKDDCFIDVGAHYGYFSLLAAKITNGYGRVLSFEPSKNNYSILKTNTKTHQDIECFNYAVSDQDEDIMFYEFPVVYSEYNTITTEQFEKQDWYTKNKPVKSFVKAVKLDNIITSKAIIPKMIKIDVEGAEDKVVKGMSDYLQTNSCTLIMEYLSKERKNKAHQNAVALLKDFGFRPYLINTNGSLVPVTDIDKHLEDNKIDSDNIVFKK